MYKYLLISFVIICTAYMYGMEEEYPKSTRKEYREAKREGAFRRRAEREKERTPYQRAKRRLTYDEDEEELSPEYQEQPIQKQ